MSTINNTDDNNNDDKLIETIGGIPVTCKKTVIEFITKDNKTYVTKFEGQMNAECPDYIDDKSIVLDSSGNQKPDGIKAAKDMYTEANAEAEAEEAENAEAEAEAEKAEAEKAEAEEAEEAKAEDAKAEDANATGVTVTQQALQFKMPDENKLNEARTGLKPTGVDVNKGGKRNTKKANKEKKGGKGKKSKKVTFAISKKQRKARRNATHRK
jgi:hypothetical protein